MRVAEIWRSPITSMEGERLERALVTASGQLAIRCLIARPGMLMVGDDVTDLGRISPSAG